MKASPIPLFKKIIKASNSLRLDNFNRLKEIGKYDSITFNFHSKDTIENQTKTLLLNNKVSSSGNFLFQLFSKSMKQLERNQDKIITFPYLFII